MKRVVLVAVLALASRAEAQPITLIAPPYPARRTGGALEPELHTGRSAMTLETSIASGVAGSNGFAASIGLPFPDVEPGWIIGASAGLSNSAVVPGRYISPSEYFWEIIAGRAQVTPFGDGDSGLHGYLEILLRDQRPQPTAEVSNALSSLGLGLRDHNLAFGVRLGAANDQLGTGLVEQGPPTYAVAFQAAAIMPLSQQGLVLNLHGESTREIWRPWLRAGIAGSLLTWGAQIDENLHLAAENQTRRYGLGGVVDFRFERRYLVRMIVDVGWLTSTNRTIFAPPGVLLSTSLTY